MIVVAIIGILAAVAIPGFMKYIRDSKTSEAKTQLKAIGEGAAAYFEAEHYFDNGMKSQTKYYPGCGKKADAAATKFTESNCSGTDNPIGKLADASTIGTKFSPADYGAGTSEDGNTQTGLNNLPWTSLRYTISSPFYYYYTYASNITPGTSKFQAKAAASLSTAADSIFYLNGTMDGTMSAIIDVSGESTATVTATVE